MTDSLTPFEGQIQKVFRNIPDEDPELIRLIEATKAGGVSLVFYTPSRGYYCSLCDKTTATACKHYTSEEF